MLDRMLSALMLILILLVSGFLLYQREEFRKYEIRQQIVEQEIRELKKKDRINAQDIQFLEALIIKGGINEK